RFHCRAGRPMRLLHERHDYGREGAAEPDSSPHGRSGEERPCGQPVPLRHAHPNHSRGHARGEGVRTAMQDFEISRRAVLGGGGWLLVAFGSSGTLAKRAAAQSSAGAGAAKPVAPDLVDSFLAIHADGSATIYTSKVDVGTGLA